MAWLWNSWEEYVQWVHPSEVQIGHFKESKRETKLEAEQSLLSAVNSLNNLSVQLHKLGFGDNRKSSSDLKYNVGEVSAIVAQTIRAGEELLLYHKRLTLSEVSYGFLHQNDLLEHWDRYVATDRISFHIQQLIIDVIELLDRYSQMSREDEKLIIGKIELPNSLERDFRLSRDLFSVGFDEIGLLVAGRGLEGVLREIARNRRIELEIKGKSSPVAEIDFFDLIETMSRVRWKTTGRPLIPRDTKALLHYLRTIRNSGAHTGSSSLESQDFRETATVVANTANSLWKSVTTSRARLDPTTVLKSW
ncbi:MAG TPA: hypothetical protein VKG86_01780 [Terracidiphilus sp.]|nr:hypothetical protein [Terracidiphilus sp.]